MLPNLSLRVHPFGHNEPLTHDDATLKPLPNFESQMISFLIAPMESYAMNDSLVIFPGVGWEAHVTHIGVYSPSKLICTYDLKEVRISHPDEGFTIKPHELQIPLTALYDTNERT